jgi:hypothetical protein
LLSYACNWKEYDLLVLCICRIKTKTVKIIYFPYLDLSQNVKIRDVPNSLKSPRNSECLFNSNFSVLISSCNFDVEKYSLCLCTLWIYRMMSLVLCCARIVNQNKWPTLLHDRADVTVGCLLNMFPSMVFPKHLYISGLLT